MTPLTILKHHKRNFEKEAEIEVIFFDLSTSGFNHSESPPLWSSDVIHCQKTTHFDKLDIFGFFDDPIKNWLK